MRKPQPEDPAMPRVHVPKAGEGKRGESGHLGYLLRQAGVAHRHRFEAELAAVGITNPQFVVLTMLANYSGLSGADLARLSLLTPQTVSVIVANLLKAGLVQRHKHAVHGRIQQIEVTAAGRAMLVACRKPVERLEAWLRQDLTAAEEQVVRRWLVRLGKESD